MIPKIIHYVWLGNKEKPDSVLKCIKSWKKYCPDWEIREWGNEVLTTIDNEYCLEAIQAKKWAFASDYIRLLVLKKYGGIYLDTDSELTAPIDQFLDNKFFIGFEKFNGVCMPSCSPIGATKGHFFIKAVLNQYKNLHFIHSKGEFNMLTLPKRFFTMLQAYEPKNNYLNGRKIIPLKKWGKIYPYWYFCIQEKNKSNYAIHHFDGSWLDDYGYKNKLILPYSKTKELVLRKYKQQRKNIIFSKKYLLQNEKLVKRFGNSEKVFWVILKRIKDV